MFWTVCEKWELPSYTSQECDGLLAIFLPSSCNILYPCCLLRESTGHQGNVGGTWGLNLSSYFSLCDQTDLRIPSSIFRLQICGWSNWVQLNLVKHSSFLKVHSLISWSVETKQWMVLLDERSDRSIWRHKSSYKDCICWWGELCCLALVVGEGSQLPRLPLLESAVERASLGYSIKMALNDSIVQTLLLEIILWDYLIIGYLKF